MSGSQSCFATKKRENVSNNEKQHNMITRKPEIFMVQKTKTEMLKTSAIIYMQNLLSKENWG